MLRTCSSALLLTTDGSLAECYRSLAPMCNVELTVEDRWNVRFKAEQDVIITEREFMGSIASEYRSRIVMLLRGDDRISEVRSLCDRFIFSRDNMQELMYAFLVPEDSTGRDEGQSMGEILTSVRRTRFRKGDYDFDFVNGTYRYRGKGIYLTKMQRLMLARWLLLGKRDHNASVHLYQLRKKFGREFLADVSRFGEIRRNT